MSFRATDPVGVVNASDTRHFSARTSFWMIAALFLVSMAFSVTTTAMWTTYQVREHFDTLMATVAFSVYAGGVLVSLYLAGHVSDWKGRKPVLLSAVVLEVISAILWPPVAPTLS